MKNDSVKAEKNLAGVDAQSPRPALLGVDIRAMREAAESAKAEGKYYVSVPIEQQIKLINEAVESHLGIPTDVNTVRWAEQSMRLADALRDLLEVIEIDNLIPESVSYMRQARAAMKDWPELPKLPVPPFPATTE